MIELVDGALEGDRFFFHCFYSHFSIVYRHPNLKFYQFPAMGLRKPLKALKKRMEKTSVSPFNVPFDWNPFLTSTTIVIIASDGEIQDDVSCHILFFYFFRHVQIYILYST